MATAAFNVIATTVPGSAVGTFHVDVAPPATSGLATFHVDVSTPPQYLYVWDGAQLVAARLGRYNGTTIDWMSPSL